jgi:NADPH-dependent 2,4-dienoyl-CoA reductase/sulfur reductase-like enzyme
MFDRHHGPAGVHWVYLRVVGHFPLKEQVQVTKVEAVDNVARLTLSNGEVLDFDHILLGTGYRTDVKQLPMLDTSLRDSIVLANGFPLLNPSFESSIPGLYFVGYSSLRSFGPFFRFVAGVDAASRHLSKAVARRIVQL